MLIIKLLSFIILIDMFNGFFIMNIVRLPISQIYKFVIILLMLLRLTKSKDFNFVVIIFFILQVAPLWGAIKSVQVENYFRDFFITIKWFIIPLSFFYFKALYESNSLKNMKENLYRMIKKSLIFIFLNMFLGYLGFGMSFYHHGYENAIGTRGFIYAGNELTILVLTLSFIISLYLYKSRDYVGYAISFIFFFIISLLITSKTILGGVFIVYVIPYISSINIKVRLKKIIYIFLFLILGFPFIVAIFYYSVNNIGIIEKIQKSFEKNNNEILTVILSNRNNFVSQGWEVFKEKYTFFDKVLGMGEGNFMELASHTPEVDFFTLLFYNGILGIVLLFILILYWFFNVLENMKYKEYIYANEIFFFLVVVIFISNLSGHVFNSGISGFFIGFTISLMFFKRIYLNKS